MKILHLKIHHPAHQVNHLMLVVHQVAPLVLHLVRIVLKIKEANRLNNQHSQNKNRLSSHHNSHLNSHLQVVRILRIHHQDQKVRIHQIIPQVRALLV